MAILVYLRKTRETDTELEYLFGDSPESMNRAVVIDKTSQTWAAADGRDDRASSRAGSWLVHRHRRTGTWIDGGTIAS